MATPKEKIYMAVPAWYSLGWSSWPGGSQLRLVDGDLKTALALSGTGTQTFSLGSLWEPQGFYLFQCSPFYAGNINFSIAGYSGLGIDQAYSERLDEGRTLGAWNFQSTYLMNNSGDTGNALVVFDSSSPLYNQMQMNTVGLTSTNLIEGWFCKLFQLPMFLQEYDISGDFQDTAKGDRTDTGNLFPHIEAARVNQMMVTSRLTWDGMDSTERDTFESFLAAFNNRITMPFVICTIRGDLVNRMDSGIYIMDSNSIALDRKRTPETGALYSASLKVRQLVLPY